MHREHHGAVNEHRGQKTWQEGIIEYSLIIPTSFQRYFSLEQTTTYPVWSEKQHIIMLERCQTPTQATNIAFQESQPSLSETDYFGPQWSGGKSTTRNCAYFTRNLIN